MGSWDKLINKKTLRLLSKSEKEQSREEVVDRDVHLEIYNSVLETARATYKPRSTAGLAITKDVGDSRSVDHITSVLNADTFQQVKILTDDPDILPNGNEAEVDPDTQEYVARSLYAGA